jgi:hypothetical protein
MNFVVTLAKGKAPVNAAPAQDIRIPFFHFPSMVEHHVYAPSIPSSDAIAKV